MMVNCEEIVGPFKTLSQPCSGALGKTTKLQSEGTSPTQKPKTTLQIFMPDIFTLTINR
jgi:hypothetical protein